MPTYQYQCAKGHRFEVLQRISEKPKTKCPDCGAKTTRVISGGAGLIFKGSGFYITDYGKDGKGPRKAEPAEGGSTPASASGAEKAESKSEKGEKSEQSGKGDSTPAPAKPEPKKAKPRKDAE